LDERVEVISLAQTPGGWRGRLHAYRELLGLAGGRTQVGSISMCFSADWINRFCSEQAVTCASIRGNLLQNYRLDYGWRGSLLAIAHLLAVRACDHVVSMTDAMAAQVHSISAVRSKLIANFIDEAALEDFRSNEVRNTVPMRFVFVGSLSKRKQPELLISAIEKLSRHEVRLDMLGDGPLRAELEHSLQIKNLQHRVRLHGHVAEPYSLMADADVLVLPSRSEGMSRAALEALHLGVPCVMREVDGNAELLTTPGAGVLFKRDEDLASAMLQAAAAARSQSRRTTLLPDALRQNVAAGQYLSLLES
jgi:glycosyltransferase involved in cell wall biosynthesis